MKTTQINDFWQWLVEQSEHFAMCFERRESDFIDEILEKLRTIRPGLAVEFEKSGESILMTVSADGDEENFDIVPEIVRHRKHVPGWEFVAFRQPMHHESLENVSVGIRGLKISIKELTFFPEMDNGKLYIGIFGHQLTEENRELFSYACFLLLDNILGEYACVKDVSGYEFYHCDEPEPPVELRSPLANLKIFLDGYHGRKKN